MKYIWLLTKKVNFILILYSTEIQNAKPNFFLGRFAFDLTCSVFVGFNIGHEHSLHLEKWLRIIFKRMKRKKSACKKSIECALG